MLIPSNDCFKANFEEFYMFSSKKLMELLLFLTVKSKNSVNLARETREILVYHIAFSVFGKVRELVGEIKYAFALWDCIGKRTPLARC